MGRPAEGGVVVADKVVKPPRIDRFATLNEFVDEGLPALLEAGKPTVALTWLYLFRHAHYKTGELKPAQVSVRKIAAATGMSKTSAFSAIRKLIELGKLISTDKPGHYTLAHTPATSKARRK